MARPKGSVNKATQTKRNIQSEMRNKPPRKKRTVAPRGIIPLTESYRILLDNSNYILQRKFEKDEKPPEEGLIELVDDEEVEVVDTTPGAERWGDPKYYTLNSIGLADLMDKVAHYTSAKKFTGKTVTFAEYANDFRANRQELVKLIKEALA